MPGVGPNQAVALLQNALRRVSGNAPPPAAAEAAGPAAFANPKLDTRSLQRCFGRCERENGGRASDVENARQLLVQGYQGCLQGVS
jgi:hypothetical protein